MAALRGAAVEQQSAIVYRLSVSLVLKVASSTHSSSLGRSGLGVQDQTRKLEDLRYNLAKQQSDSAWAE